MRNRDRSVEARLRRLERTNRALLAGLVAVAAGAVLLGQAAVDVPQFPLLRVERLEVVNPATGSVAAVLGTDADGGTLTLNPRDGGRPLAFLGADEDGGMLRVWSRSGTPLGFFGTDNDGGLMLLNRAGGELASVVGTDDRGGLMYIRDERSAVVEMRIDEEGGLVTVTSPGPREAALLGVDGSQAGILTLYDAENQPTLTLRRGHRSGGLLLFDANGQPRAVLTINEAGQAELRPFNPETDQGRPQPTNGEAEVGEIEDAPAGRRVPRFE
ncbi:MAG: hypothetical protein EA378_09540 [Phycisphaerales bacterium]|nr:MAG: hypothetical protein EA378_09540 [Phycisphaerales bacterium]